MPPQWKSGRSEAAARDGSSNVVFAGSKDPADPSKFVVWLNISAQVLSALNKQVSLSPASFTGAEFPALTEGLPFYGDQNIHEEFASTAKDIQPFSWGPTMPQTYVDVSDGFGETASGQGTLAEVRAKLIRAVPGRSRAGDVAAGDGQVVGAAVGEAQRPHFGGTLAFFRQVPALLRVLGFLGGLRGGWHLRRMVRVRPAAPHWYLAEISVEARGWGTAADCSTSRSPGSTVRRRILTWSPRRRTTEDCPGARVRRQGTDHALAGGRSALDVTLSGRVLTDTTVRRPSSPGEEAVRR